MDIDLIRPIQVGAALVESAQQQALARERAQLEAQRLLEEMRQQKMLENYRNQLIELQKKRAEMDEAEELRRKKREEDFINAVRSEYEKEKLATLPEGYEMMAGTASPPSDTDLVGRAFVKAAIKTGYNIPAVANILRTQMELEGEKEKQGAITERMLKENEARLKYQEGKIKLQPPKEQGDRDKQPSPDLALKYLQYLVGQIKGYEDALQTLNSNPLRTEEEKKPERVKLENVLAYLYKQKEKYEALLSKIIEGASPNTGLDAGLGDTEGELPPGTIQIGPYLVTPIEE